MKIHPTITLYEMATILREHLGEKFNCEIGDIVVESYGKPVIGIGTDDMITTIEIRHQANK